MKKLTVAKLLMIGLSTLAVGWSDSRAGEIEHLEVGPNVGRNHPVGAPVDVYWDDTGRKLHARSLILTEVGDPVDLRIRRAPGKYPDGPLTGTSQAGSVTGGIHWDALTSEGWRQVCGIEGLAKDVPAPAPEPWTHPGWLTFYTYPENYDDRVRRAIVDDTGAMSLGGGGFGGEGLPFPRYGFHLFGGGLRVEAVSAPAAPVLSVYGTMGSTRYTYQIVSRDSKGRESYPSAESTIIGPDTLDAENYIHVEWPSRPGAETYLILRDGERLDIVYRGEGTTKYFNDMGSPAKPHRPVRRNRTGDVEIDGALFVKQTLHTPETCRTPDLSSDQHDFDPVGFESCSTLVLKARTAIRITGLAAPDTEGRWLLLINDGNEPITLVDDSTHSKRRNIFRTGTEDDLLLRPNQTVAAVYILERWRFPGNLQ